MAATIGGTRAGGMVAILLASVALLGGGAGAASDAPATGAIATAAAGVLPPGPTVHATEGPAASPPVRPIGPAPTPTATPAPPATTMPTPVLPETSLPLATPVLPYTYVPATPRPYTYLPAAPGPLRVDGFARVLADDLVVRSEPTVGPGSVMLTLHLAAGDRLFVVDGPVAGSGYEWYQVRLMPPDDASDRPFGWVAAAARDGTPWIEGLAVACPTGAPNIAVLVTLAAEERLACYGRSDVTFAAWDCGVAFVDGPDPGDGSVPIRSFLIFGPRTCRPGMEAIGAEESWTGVGSRYRLTGHFSPTFFVITSWEPIDGP